MSDLISRQAAINAILHYTIRIPGYMSEWGRKLTAAIKKDLMDKINAIPHAQQWIPVEERLPDGDEIMFVTYNDPRTHERMMWCGWYEMEDVWYIDGEEHSRENGNEVVAWMPMPEPYAPTQSNDSKALDALWKGKSS